MVPVTVAVTAIDDSGAAPICHVVSVTSDETALGVGHGKRAARSIDAWLSGREPAPRPKHPSADFGKLNLWYFGDHGRREQAELDPAERVHGFVEVTAGLTPEEVAHEAGRCLSCGNCFECDNCYGVCPDNAVIKLGPGKRFEFNYDYCKGCGICVSECPCGAITMVPETV